MRVLWAGPQTGQGPQAAALHRGGHGAPPHLRRRVGGGVPVQYAEDTSLSSFPITSTHLNFPICNPPPQVLEHCVNDKIFHTNFLSPITLLSICDWLSNVLKSGCFGIEVSDFECSRSFLWVSALWCRWCLGAVWCDGWLLIGMSLLSSGSESVRNSYFMFGFGCV